MGRLLVFRDDEIEIEGTATGDQHTDGGELGAIDANHAQLVDLASPPKVEKGETDDTDLLI